MVLRVMSIYGTRPEVIKVAPVIKQIERSADMESIAVVTGQHREMLDQVSELFDIHPAHDLDIMRRGQSLNQILVNVVHGVDDVLEKEQPDVVMVQGDTSTVMGASVASFNRRVPVVHLEAGLRSGDIESPFPEEINRRLTAQVASLHLAPTGTARSNLLSEGVNPADVIVTGNTVIDTLMHVSQLADVEIADVDLRATVDSGRRIVLVTVHRRENLGTNLEQIALAVADIARAHPEATVVLPMHRNPRVREVLPRVLAEVPNILLLEPLGYAEFTLLLKRAYIVLTDSGGVQEEAPTLGAPVLVMRENTERPEAVEAGTVKLVGTARAQILAEAERLLRDEAAYRSMANAVNPYGDGRAAGRVVDAMRWKFLGELRPRDFRPSPSTSRDE